MLIYKLLGGTTSARQPGDPANMFQYTGPRGIKVQPIHVMLSMVHSLYQCISDLMQTTW